MEYWPIEELSVNEIFLDPKNIRMPLEDVSQSALIQDLFINEDALEIAKSISNQNMFHDEFPIVILDNSKYIMIEGNRRLAALKALLEPDLLPSFKTRIKNLSNPEIDRIRVILAPNRDVAIDYIANRHTINFRRPWKPLRQAHFYQSQILNGKSINDLINEYPSQDIPKFIKMLEMHDLAKKANYSDEIKDKVFNERKFPITNLERMYNEAYVREFLNITFNIDGKVKIHISEIEFLKLYSPIVVDIVTNEIDSRKYNTEDQRKIYVNNLKAKLINESAKNNEDKTQNDTTDFSGNSEKDSESTSESSNESSASKGEKHSKRRESKKPKSLVPDYVNFNLESSALEVVFNELKSINVKQFPNAAHDLLRSFLETSLVVFLKEINELPTKNEKHNPTLDEMLAFIAAKKCSKITDNSLIQSVDHLRQQYNKNFSVARMNMINHNENWVSSEREVRDAWSKLESLMKTILKSNI